MQVALRGCTQPMPDSQQLIFTPRVRKVRFLGGYRLLTVVACAYHEQPLLAEADLEAAKLHDLVVTYGIGAHC